MNVGHQSPSKLAQLPIELIEHIFNHLVRRNPRTKAVSRQCRLLCTLSLVCHRWAPVAQNLLWKYVFIFKEHHLEKMLGSPVFRQYCIRKLHISGDEFEDAATRLLGEPEMNSLEELNWFVCSSKIATWWNSKNLCNLKILKLFRPLILPKPAMPHFKLRALCLVSSPDGWVSPIMKCCSTTLEIFEFWGNTFPSWFDGSQFPLLRILRAIVYYQNGPLSSDDLQGVTHLHLLHIKQLHNKILDPYNLPLSLRSLKILTRISRTECQQVRDFSWPYVSPNPFGDEKAFLPSLESISITILEDVGKPTRPLSHEELDQITTLQAFWKRCNVSFEANITSEE